MVVTSTIEELTTIFMLDSIHYYGLKVQTVVNITSFKRPKNEPRN